MSIFSSIMSKIFHTGAAATANKVEAAPQTPANSGSPPTPEQSAAVPAQPVAPSQPVDVEAILSKMADQKGGGGNYQRSIVDLLKLLDLDSSLAARKELADELNVHAGVDGSADENVALHQAVMKKLEENGGKVPDSLKGK